ncbi:putative Co-chaperone protein [Podospora fimiseda]|uniref:Co-chaperone protein n=1 Tax=Podospora fimiseda TaxID=252190 RepID=A0AAN7H8I1_9PEZI|nr:putative Co-chaperone protein [Podospora fimiseda]
MRALSVLPTTITTTAASWSPGRSRAGALFWVCATCRREAVSTTSPLLRAASFSTTSSFSSEFAKIKTKKQTNLLPPLLHLRQGHRDTQQRSLSTPASQPIQTSKEHKEPQAPPPQPACKQHNKTLPFYALFPETLPDGPPPTGPFHIDLQSLRREFLRLQATSHPDLHHSVSAPAGPSGARSPARLRAEATSAFINSAYTTLANPLTRAQYLLNSELGVDLAEDESTGEAAGGLEPELLGTVMEAREAIDEAECEEDLRGVQEENEKRIEECEGRLEDAFGKGDWEGAKRETVRLRYWINIREGIRDWEGPGRGVVVHH